MFVLKHGRPKVAEPTVQQWIGDSAAIPCTPDVPGPKPKKSPRWVQSGPEPDVKEDSDDDMFVSVTTCC